jgi:hypothetical protein
MFPVQYQLKIKCLLFSLPSAYPVAMFLKIENALPVQVAALDVKALTSSRQDTEYVDNK